MSGVGLVPDYKVQHGDIKFARKLYEVSNVSPVHAGKMHCALVCWKSVRMCERAVISEPPVAGTEPVAPKGDRACKRARDSSGVFLNPNSCKGFEPEPSKEGSG